MPAGLASQAGSWAGHLRFRGAKGGESWHELLPSGSSPGRSPLVPAAEEGTSVSWWCVCLSVTPLSFSCLLAPHLLLLPPPALLPPLSLSTWTITIAPSPWTGQHLDTGQMLSLAVCRRLSRSGFELRIGRDIGNFKRKG